jgi:hypothetical protein
MDQDGAIGQVCDQRLDCDIAGGDFVIQPAQGRSVDLSILQWSNLPFRECLLLDIDPLLLEQYHCCISPSRATEGE